MTDPSDPLAGPDSDAADTTLATILRIRHSSATRILTVCPPGSLPLGYAPTPAGRDRHADTVPLGCTGLTAPLSTARKACLFSNSTATAIHLLQRSTPARRGRGQSGHDG